MRYRHPFEWLSQSGQKRAFVPLVALTLVVMAGLQVLDGPLKSEVAPSGIVSFEFAGELSDAQSMVESWGQEGQVYAGLSLDWRNHSRSGGSEAKGARRITSR
ncbi:MAG: hypothetical protein DRJ03_17100 [Chloroflexi bacterium]|nr:MAG: hypothetical protein B6I35_13380 [Anaerolineaceae bacterium 4572_32.2]RLC77598.1 MAG: hypothetical protein DRI81_08315 [Chloroflexota bacterium]RLC83467.1 MAG: hypothetical protein DRJ03_17100 [Chloroflexota bacterium]HEY73099.1 hypothetical protein [Thermoflexia bacterium]